MKNITFNNGVSIPMVGLGTWQSTETQVYDAVKHALKIGYRHIDAASAYENEKEVGQGIVDSEVKREDIFLTSKLWNSVDTYEGTIEAFTKTLEDLKTDYLDLYLIHWPGDRTRILEVWRAMEELHLQGKIRAIGVSNFNIHHLDIIMANGTVQPAVNQVECHVKVQNVRLQRYCQQNDIILQAYAPMMSHKVKELASIETLVELSKKYKKTETQICLRWMLQRDIVVLPKSVTPSRIEENIALFDFELTAEEMLTIRKLNTGTRLFPDPDNMDFGFPL